VNREFDNVMLRHITQKIPRDIRELMSQHPRKCIVGGGFVRDVVAGIDPSDVDVFSDSKERSELMAKDLVAKRGEGTRMHTTQNAITVLTNNRLPVQFITRWAYSEPRLVLDSFDFTVCQAAVWRCGPGSNDAWVGWHGGGFYRDLAAKNLVYTSPKREEEAGGSLLRAIKFLRRGYRIQVTSIARLVERLSSAAEVMADSRMNCTRMDAMDMLLREVDPLMVIDGLDVEDDHATEGSGEAV